MKFLSFLLLASATSIAAAAPKDTKPKAPKTISEILALSPYELTRKLGNTSEVGQDYAYQLWAVAKRVDTEGKLAKKDVALIAPLNNWREILDNWQDSLMSAASFISGGGTMYSHQAARNNAELEKFLAAHAEGLAKELNEPVKQQIASLSASMVEAVDDAAKEQRNKDIQGRPGQADVKEYLADSEATLLRNLALLADKDTREAVLNWAKASAKFASEF